MMKSAMISRRGFLGSMVAAGAAWGLGLPRRLAWSAPIPAGEAFRFVFFTDVHTRVEWETPLALEMAAKAMNSQSADLVLAGGDLITDGFDSTEGKVAPRWDAFMEMWNSLRGPQEAAIGNHDLVAARPADGSPASPDPRAIFREKLDVSRTYRSFDAGGCHFILLDGIQVTDTERNYRGFIDSGQMEWLSGDLEGVNPETPVILVSHVPLLTAFYQATEGATAPAPDHRVIVNSVDVLKCLEPHNLVLVMQGHLHVDEMLRWRRTTFITGGAVSGAWWRGPRRGTDAGFGVVTLRNGRVEWEYINYGWIPRRPSNA
jgi:Icc protein